MALLQKPALAVLFATVLFASLLAPVAHAQTETIGYWRFEEGALGDAASGPILDSSPGSQNANPTGNLLFSLSSVNPTPLTSAPNALSLQFAGANDSVVFGSPFPFNVHSDATIEFWMRVTRMHHGAVLWGLPGDFGSGRNRFHFYVNSDHTVGFDYFPPGGGPLHPIFGQGTPFGGVPVALLNWNHFAITKSGNDYALYINGLLFASRTDLSPDLPTATSWSISGRGGGGAAVPFMGQIDELRVSNVALEPDQFLYSSGGLPGTR